MIIINVEWNLYYGTYDNLPTIIGASEASPTLVI